jgi:hypothetical protein
VLYDSLVVAMGVRTFPGGLGSPLPYEVYAGPKTRAPRVQARQEFINFFDTQDDTTPATDFTHGIPQLLALMNAQQFNAVSPLIEDLAKADLSADKGVERLFLATLSRPPSPDEVRIMTGYLAKRSDKKQGYNGVLWILFNSSEFVLNH